MEDASASMDKAAAEFHKRDKEYEADRANAAARAAQANVGKPMTDLSGSSSR